MGFLSVLLFFIHALAPDFPKNLESKDSVYHRHTFAFGVNYGAIWAHNPPVYHLAQSHPIHLAAEYLRLSPEREWGQTYNNPYFGLALHYFNYQSPKLGSSLAAVVFLEPILYKRFRYRIGTGMVANFRPFNLKTNTTNNMLGGPVALVMHGQILYYQPLAQQYQLRFGIGLTHFSNGAFTQPNSGINNFFAGIALCHSSKGKPRPTYVRDSTRISRGFSFVVSTSFSLVEKYPVEGPKYPIYHLSGRGQYRVGRLSSLLLGLDYIRNMAIAKILEEEPQLGTEVGRVAMTLGHELHISKVSMITELGIYIRKKQNLDPNAFQRYGLRYYWTKKFYSGMYLKSHKARAECIEWSLGWKFG